MGHRGTGLIFVTTFLLCFEVLLGERWEVKRTQKHHQQKIMASYNEAAPNLQKRTHVTHKGRSRKKKMKRGYIWQMANKSGR
jgi:hypothetical protein